MSGLPGISRSRGLQAVSGLPESVPAAANRTSLGLSPGECRALRLEVVDGDLGDFSGGAAGVVSPRAGLGFVVGGGGDVDERDVVGGEGEGAAERTVGLFAGDVVVNGDD